MRQQCILLIWQETNSFKQWAYCWYVTMSDEWKLLYGSLIKIDDIVEGKQKAAVVGLWCVQSEFIFWAQMGSEDKIRNGYNAPAMCCRFSIFFLSVSSVLSLSGDQGHHRTAQTKQRNVQ